MTGQRLAKYPNLIEHLSTLAWSRSELLSKAGNPCSERSVKRLEDGFPIRHTNVSKLFAAINQHMDDKLDYKTEIQIIQT